MRIGIVGSRRRNTTEDLDIVVAKFMEIYHDNDTIISGGCPSGGDKFAEFIAKNYQIPITIYYAKWDKFGKGAGFIRNTTIAEESNILIACVAPDRTGGTEDTIKKFLKNHYDKDLYLI
jgi:hypothetical protein